MAYLHPVTSDEVANLVADIEAEEQREAQVEEGDDYYATEEDRREAERELEALRADAAAAEEAEAEIEDGEDRWATEEDRREAERELEALRAETAAAEEAEASADEGEDRWTTADDLAEAAREARDLNRASFLAGGRISYGLLALIGLALPWACNLSAPLMATLGALSPPRAFLAVFAAFVEDNVVVAQESDASGANALTRLVFIVFLLTLPLVHAAVRARTVVGGRQRRGAFAAFHAYGMFVAVASAFPLFLFIDGPGLRSRRSLSRNARALPNPVR